MILYCLVEGNMRDAACLCDLEKRTVLNILTLSGEACERLFTERVRNVMFHDLELDEVWTFVGCKQKRLAPERVEAGMAGDAYTFIGPERTSKLVVAWHLGKRNRMNTEDFISRFDGRQHRADSMLVPMHSRHTRTRSDAGLYDRANHAQVVNCSPTAWIA